MPDEKGFLTSAKEFIKNPLGLIGLFVSIIYLLSTVVLITVIPKLETDMQRLPLIYFTIIFPVLILAAFVYLVAKHHHKLYAPTDFKDEKNFLQAMDADAQKRKMDKEVDDIIGEVDEPSDILGDMRPRSRGAAPATTPVSPGDAKDRSLLRAQYLIAEDLAFRALEVERGFKVQRHVELNNATGRASQLDGVAVTNESIYVIEVKFSTNGQIAKTAIPELENYVNEFQAITRHSGRPATVKGIAAFVLMGSDVDKIRDDFAKKTQHSNKTEIVIFSFEELKRRFGVTA